MNILATEQACLPVFSFDSTEVDILQHGIEAVRKQQLLLSEATALELHKMIEQTHLFGALVELPGGPLDPSIYARGQPDDGFYECV